MNARQARSLAPAPDARVEAAKRRLADAVAELVDAQVARMKGPSDWISQHDSPLGHDRHLRLCRKGILPAVSDGNRRLVRRSDIDAYLLRNPLPVKKADDSDEESVEDVMRKIEKGARR